jgi:hypothetical protein
VLRARQPDGARIDWDETGVVEWDGGWRRASVPWSRARAARLVWKTTSRARTTTHEAIQLVDTASGAAITVWPFTPPGVPNIRRRLCSEGVAALHAAIEDHHVPIGAAFDPALAMEHGRATLGPIRWVWRLGYVAAVVAPLVAGPAPVWGLALGAAGTLLLVARALPVYAELRALGGSAARERDPDRKIAEGLRRRAVLAEAVARTAFFLLVPASTLVSVYALPM